MEESNPAGLHRSPMAVLKTAAVTSFATRARVLFLILILAVLGFSVTTLGSSRRYGVLLFVRF